MAADGRAARSRGVAIPRFAALSMASGTALSRVTGLLRTTALAAALGVTWTADAFNTASAVPTMLLVLVSGGTLSAVLVPSLSRRADPQERSAYASEAAALILFAAAMTSLALIVAAPAVAQLFAVGMRGRASYDAYVDASTTWLRLLAPQILFLGLSVFAAAVLTAARRLGVVGVTPVLPNVFTIAGASAFVALGGLDQLTPSGRVHPFPAVALGALSTVGVAAMAWTQLIAARRVLPGLTVLRRPRFRGVVARELADLGRWSVVYVVANQVGFVVVLVLANGLPGGATAYLWGFTIMQLPYGIVAVSILAATQARLTEVRGNLQQLRGLASQTLDSLVVILAPTSIALLLLAEPVARISLGYGAAGRQGVELIALALRGFALVLLPFSVFQFLTRMHYAVFDTRTPALVNLWVNGVNILLALLAFLVLDGLRSRLIGLVVAYGASYLVGSAYLTVTLARRHEVNLGASVIQGRAAIASLPTLAVLLIGAKVLHGPTGRPWTLLCFVVMSTAVYAGSLALLTRFGRRRIVWRPLPDDRPPTPGSSGQG